MIIIIIVGAGNGEEDNEEEEEEEKDEREEEEEQVFHYFIKRWRVQVELVNEYKSTYTGRDPQETGLWLRDK